MDQKQRIKKPDQRERDGVISPGRDGAVIAGETVLSRGCIYPGTVVEGASLVGGGCILGPNTVVVSRTDNVGSRDNAPNVFTPEIGGSKGSGTKNMTFETKPFKPESARGWA